MSQKVILQDEGGRGGPDPPNKDDIIGEQPLICVLINLFDFDQEVNYSLLRIYLRRIICQKIYLKTSLDGPVVTLVTPTHAISTPVEISLV